MVKFASIIIPTCNGKHLLEECLPSVMEAVDVASGHEVIVVDDGSSDGSYVFLKENFPQVKIVSLDKNHGFGKACNTGVQKSLNPIVILLNNDIKVDKDFISPLIKNFNNENVFAVSGKVFQWNRKNKYVERTFGNFRKGLLYLSSVPSESNQITLYAGGGMSAFDREKFMSLGGFDELYKPFYNEDLDLSYRAWKNGWKVLYEPGSIMYHRHAATISKSATPFMVKIIKNRNMFLFIWKNINDTNLILSHLFFLPFHLLKWLVTLKPSAPLGFLWALSKIGQVIKKRKENQVSNKLTDREILSANPKEEKTHNALKEALKRIYHRNWEKFHVIRRIEWETVSSWLKPAKGDKILDAGCGTGYFVRALSKKGYLTHGFDISGNALKNATKYNKEQNCFYSLANASELPYASSTFDKAVSVCCLEHFTDDDKALLELARILKENGRLVLSVDAYNNKWVDENFRQKCAKAFSIERFYDIELIKKKLNKSGFSCLRYKYLFHYRTSYFIFRLVYHYEKIVYLFLLFFPLLYVSAKLSDCFSKNRDEGFILVVEAQKNT